MTGADASAHAPGEHLLAELKWVHERIRHDLDLCTELADDVSAGVAPTEVRDRVRALKANSPIWMLRVNCLHYCRFVHAHHGAEDVGLFPAVRHTNPELAPVVDKLEADHREVSVRLDEIEAAVNALVADDGDAARARVARGLAAIREVLLVHLAYEEESIGPAILAWDGWPTRASEGEPTA